MHKLMVVLLTLLVMSLVGACAPPAQPIGPDLDVPTGPIEGGTLLYGLYAEPDSLDPHVTGQSHALLVVQQVAERLIYKDEDGAIQPGLATSWEVSDDRLTYTFRLREGVRFHDDTPFNAEAVQFNFDRIVDPETRSRFAAAILGPYDRTEVVDDHTVKIHLTEPMTPFLDALSHPAISMMSPTMVEKSTMEELLSHPVGSGPFVFEEWIPNQVIRLVRNRDYDWAPPWFENEGSAYLDAIEFKPFIEPATRVACLEAGECLIIDGRDVPMRDFLRFEESDDIWVSRFPEMGIPRQFQYNLRYAPTDELAVRKAIHLGINRQEVSEDLYGGLIGPAYGLLAPGTPGYLEWDEAKDYNPEQAKSILEEAGWVDTSGNGIRERDGNRLEIILFSLPDDPLNELIQAQLRQIGIDVTISVTTAANLRPVLLSGEDWHLFLFGSTSSDPDVLWPMFHGSLAGQRPNYPYYDNPRVNELLDLGRVTPDGEERLAIYREIQELMQQDLPGTPVYIRTTMHAIGSNLKGLVWTAQGDFLFFYDSYIEN